MSHTVDVACSRSAALRDAPTKSPIVAGDASRTTISVMPAGASASRRAPSNARSSLASTIGSLDGGAACAGVARTTTKNTSARTTHPNRTPVSYTHLRAHETPEHLVCRLLLEKK